MDSQLEALLNRLLEAERAGHQLFDAMGRETSDSEVSALLVNFTNVEVSDTAILEGLIRLHGGTPSTTTGDFADKVLRLSSLADQINLLSQGQAWVARKVEQVLALNPPPDMKRKRVNRFMWLEDTFSLCRLSQGNGQPPSPQYGVGPSRGHQAVGGDRSPRKTSALAGSDW